VFSARLTLQKIPAGTRFEVGDTVARDSPSGRLSRELDRRARRYYGRDGETRQTVELTTAAELPGCPWRRPLPVEPRLEQ